ncbi:Serine/threonine-protein kinase [Coemansia sp. BCRC 34301]|nr:Serine/threonine-protein kinase [Coemansia sp. BCRC 34301]
MGQAASHALVAAADLQPPLAMGVSGLETELGESVGHIRMLGSTRFMKTILCKLAHEGQLVLHVFMRPVSMSLDVRQQIDRLGGIYRILSKAQHVLSHVRVFSDERAVYIVRQYLHNNLYDRISTRPFLCNAEKRWIAYQMLVGLREAHSRGVCHGDIKAENVVVTSWNLVYLTDFAPFKPTYLPADDPAEFNFYFDGSGRQSCCIAPERFYDAGSKVGQALAAAATTVRSKDGLLELQPSMDIFSVGCVIAELFLDGNPLFSLSRLLQYRSSTKDGGDGLVAAAAAAEIASGIADVEIAGLVQHMIQLEPSARLSAGEYLDRWAGVFPKAPQAAYMDTAGADARMEALYEETVSSVNLSCEITATVACANVRNCQKASSRSMGVKVLDWCGSKEEMLGDPDLILPYLVGLAGDPSARVRMEAIVAMRDLLLRLRRLTAINGNMFDDYLGPQLQYLAADSSVGVRCVVASVLGDMAGSAHDLQGISSFLGEQLRAVVSRLSFDAAEVKHILLCSFPQLYGVGLQSLSHIITYLNDRDSWFLRAGFFDVVFAASAQISRHASREYIVPLINLHDQEVFVVISALRALVRLVPQLSAGMLWDKLAEVQAACSGVAGLRRAGSEFTALGISSARLPMAADVAGVALAMQRVDRGERAAGKTEQTAAAADRLVQLRAIGAPLRTVFLTAAHDPWAGGGKVADDGLARFLRRRAPDPASPAPAAAPAGQLRGSLMGEVHAHSEEVTCVVAGRSGVFVSGSSDGTVRAFDAAGFRKSATVRAVAEHVMGGRVTGLAYSGGLDCVAAVSDCGLVHVLRASRSGLRVLATTRLARGEHGVAVCFGRASDVVVVTSRSRVLVLEAAALREAGAVQLAPSHGRPTSVAGSSGWAFVVVGTARGSCVVADVRFCVEVRAYGRPPGAAGVTALAALGDDSVVVASAAGEVSLLSLRSGRRSVCAGARPLHELRAAAPSRRLRVNGLVRVPQSAAVLAASNDALLRLWDLDRLEKSYVVNAADPAPPPYASYRLNDTVYFCENAPALHAPPPLEPASRTTAVAANSSRAAASPITAVAVLATPAAMVVCGHQNGCIRVMI